MRGFLERLVWRTERFMQGRNGMDDMSRSLYWLGLILLILSIFLGRGTLNLLAMICFGYSIFRMLSTNVNARQSENTWYLNKTAGLRSRFGRGASYGGNAGAGRNPFADIKKNAEQQKLRFDERKEYRFFKCKCGATLRVKRGQGTKELICPICKEHMTRNTD